MRQNRRNFENHVMPILGKMIVNQTAKAHWLSLFDGMGRRVVTGEVLELMQHAFRFCSNRGVIDINPIESLCRSDVEMTAAMRDRMLSDDEIRVVWDALDGMPVKKQFVVRFLVITGCRSTEIRTSKWDWFDYKSKTWTVPASEYKTGRTVRCALPEAAISLLKEHQKGALLNKYNF